MADANANCDWQERFRRIDEEFERNLQSHEVFQRNLGGLRESMVEQKGNLDQLMVAHRQLIDRIPPENLR